MTAGLAHNLNNIFGAVIPALDELAEQVQAREDANLVMRSVRQASAMVQRVMAFVHHETSTSRQPESLSELAKDIAELCRHAFSRRVHLELSIPPHVWVECDRSQIGQVLLNLALNARDAVRHCSRPMVRISVWEESETAYLEVADNGEGMTEEVMRKACEPFFTTKGDAGTGLGLATCQAMLEQHGTQLKLRSVPGQGSVVGFSLPGLRQDAIAH